MPLPLIIAGAALTALSGLAKMKGASSAQKAQEDAARAYANAILGTPMYAAGEKLPLRIAKYMMAKGYHGDAMPDWARVASGPLGDAVAPIGQQGQNVYAAPALGALSSEWDQNATGFNRTMADRYSGLSTRALLGDKAGRVDFKNWQNQELARALGMAPSGDSGKTAALGQTAADLSGIFSNYFLNRPKTSTPAPSGDYALMPWS
jgi:hypothetical protein